MQRFDIKVFGAVPAIVMALLLMTGTCTPVPKADATNQGKAEKQMSPRQPLTPNQETPEVPASDESHQEALETLPSNDAPQPASAPVVPPSLTSEGVEQTEEDIQTQVANGDQFVKEVLRQFFDKLRKRPMLVEEILKHETYKRLMRDRNNMDSGNAAQQTQEASDTIPKWQYIPIFAPQDSERIPPQQEQSQEQQQNIQPEPQQKQKQAQESPIVPSTDLSKTVPDNGEIEENSQTGLDRKDDSNKQQPQAVKLPQPKQTEQPQQPTEKSKSNPSNIPGGVLVEAGPESYYFYPLIAPNQDGAETESTGVKKDTGNTEQETPVLYDTEMPAYYYYFYYDDADNNDGLTEIKNDENPPEDIPNNSNNKQNAKETSLKDNNTNKIVIPKPTLKQTKGDTFEGESSREAPPSVADINAENELTKLHN